MKTGFKISAILMVSVLFYGKSCDEDISVQDENLKVNESREIVLQNFASLQPEKEDLAGFEQIARQKLADLADYLNILADTSLPYAFREQAGELAGDLFPGDETIFDRNIPLNPPVLALLQKFEQRRSECLCDKIYLVFDTGTMLNPFQQVNDSTYMGTITFRETLRFFHQQDTLYSYPIDMQAGIQLIRVDKTIGTASVRAWTVFLDEIYQY